MKNRKRISRRVLRHFLHLAAATFALGANMSPASAASDEATRGNEYGDDNRYTHGAQSAQGAAYPLSFELPGTDAPALTGRTRAQVRVLDDGGRKLMQMAVDGPSMIGPLGHGAYTLLIKANGLTEVHRLRIGNDTLPYLHFTEPV